MFKNWIIITACTTNQSFYNISQLQLNNKQERAVCRIFAKKQECFSDCTF